MQQYILFAGIGLGALLVAWLGYWLVRHGRGWVWWLLFAPLCGLAALLWWQSDQHQGWDALGYVIGLVVFVLPVMGGLLLGGMAGLLRRNAAR